jgi:glucose/arabinose dehydrogenase
MRRISAALARCLAAAVVAGCGAAQAASSGHPTPGPACPQAPGLTQADNGKTYCVRVGETVSVFLRSTQSRLWVPPLASGGVLKAVPNGAGSLVVGATAGWWDAVRPGRALVTSARPPCLAAVSAGQYALRSCAPADRFSVTIVVVG